MKRGSDRLKKPLHERRFAMEGLLLLGTFFWGMGYIWSKDIAATGVDYHVFVAFRYGIATLLLLPFCLKDIRAMNRQDLIHCLILGLLYYFSQITQVWGLKYTTPANASFITSAYVILVPFVSAFLMKTKPEKKLFVSIAICVAGLYALNFSPGEGLQINTGNAITLLCALTWSLQVPYLSYAAQTTKTTVLTAVPLLFASLLASGVGLCTGGFRMEGVDQRTFFTVVALMAIFPTIGSCLAQTYAQRFIDPTRAAIIYTLESVFTCAGSVLLGYERLTWQLLLGGGLIIFAVLLTELPGKTHPKEDRA